MTYFLIAGGVARLAIIAALNPHYVDFYCFIDATQAVIHGLDPHVLVNLRYTTWNEAPLVFPGLTLFFIPFAILAPAVGKSIYFMANVAAGMAFYGALIRASGICTRYSLREPDLQTMLVTIGGFLFVNSIFFTLCIRVGQVSTVVSLLIILSVCAAREWQRTGAFGLAAVVKYSTVPVLGLQLFLVRRRFLFCVTGFALFAVISIYPALIGHHLIDLYQSYFDCMKRWIAPGAANHFANSGQTMLSSGLFKGMPSVLVNIVVLGLFLGVGLYQRQRLPACLGLHEWFAISCVTMTLEYHRTYDGVLLYPFLLLEVVVLWVGGSKVHAVLLGAFALFFALPGAVVHRLAQSLGKAAGENPVVYLPAGEFPLLAFMILVLTLYALFLYARFGSGLAVGPVTKKAGPVMTTKATG
ncbi:MAG: DUF2029 domain-containing protein [Candidatus Hydrogenedentes bacterium]|nr:DUF2029 domain-containing protein [Candidatus Hydrogenedentota bacterium]